MAQKRQSTVEVSSLFSSLACRFIAKAIPIKIYEPCKLIRYTKTKNNKDIIGLVNVSPAQSCAYNENANYIFSN